eukprot:TRINITY_DN67287_c0_g1_i1.p1 TRINITY_DN67287_c0_g1~~TRINITY_DN67287_c0_g1_i1.p1  ORF type:complete len:910 (-),score=130.21 TRINITY_DN67287_c0_g1_i1:72-2774(-)
MANSLVPVRKAASGGPEVSGAASSEASIASCNGNAAGAAGMPTASTGSHSTRGLSGVANGTSSGGLGDEAADAGALSSRRRLSRPSEGGPAPTSLREAPFVIWRGVDSERRTDVSRLNSVASSITGNSASPRVPLVDAAASGTHATTQPTRWQNSSDRTTGAEAPATPKPRAFSAFVAVSGWGEGNLPSTARSAESPVHRRSLLPQAVDVAPVGSQIVQQPSVGVSSAGNPTSCTRAPVPVSGCPSNVPSQVSHWTASVPSRVVTTPRRHHFSENRTPAPVRVGMPQAIPTPQAVAVAASSPRPIRLSSGSSCAPTPVQWRFVQAANTACVGGGSAVIPAAVSSTMASSTGSVRMPSPTSGQLPSGVVSMPAASAAAVVRQPLDRENTIGAPALQAVWASGAAPTLVRPRRNTAHPAPLSHSGSPETIVPMRPLSPMGTQPLLSEWAGCVPEGVHQRRSLQHQPQVVTRSVSPVYLHARTPSLSCLETPQRHCVSPPGVGHRGLTVQEDVSASVKAAMSRADEMFARTVGPPATTVSAPLLPIRTPPEDQLWLSSSAVSAPLSGVGPTAPSASLLTQHVPSQKTMLRHRASSLPRLLESNVDDSPTAESCGSSFAAAESAAQLSPTVSEPCLVGLAKQRRRPGRSMRRSSSSLLAVAQNVGSWLDGIALHSPRTPSDILLSPQALGRRSPSAPVMGDGTAVAVLGATAAGRVVESPWASPVGNRGRCLSDAAWWLDDFPFGVNHLHPPAASEKEDEFDHHFEGKRSGTGEPTMGGGLNVNCVGSLDNLDGGADVGAGGCSGGVSGGVSSGGRGTTGSAVTTGRLSGTAGSSVSMVAQSAVVGPSVGATTASSKATTSMASMVATDTTGKKVRKMSPRRSMLAAAAPRGRRPVQRGATQQT